MRKKSIVTIALVVVVLALVGALLYGPIKRNFFSEEGIHLTIENRKADLNQALSIQFKGSEEEHLLYSEDLVETKEKTEHYDRPFDSEASISIQIDGRTVYTIGYVDHSVKRVFIDIDVLDIDLEKSELELRIRVHNGGERMVDRVTVKLEL